MDKINDKLQQEKLLLQEITVRRDTIGEDLKASLTEMEGKARALPAGLLIDSLQQEIEKVCKRLEKIGTVNLVAVDEFRQYSERKDYLDEQRDDLIEAMTTLETAINTIDKETRSRFAATFNALNDGFKQFFPKLFGGGKASLEMTGTNLLDTGVAVHAQPPGKRNNTIHLLSGGEKALTAVGLLFAFFELNPAPFCILDEVDAPLDDANVGRYVVVLKQLARTTQLIL